MGRSGSGGQAGVSAAQEIANLQANTANAGMRLLTKSHPRTWSNTNSTSTSDLDQVVLEVA